jgi:hypothetical protein
MPLFELLAVLVAPWTCTACSVMTAETVAVFHLAVTVAVVPVCRAPVRGAKVTKDWPAGIATAVGTLTADVLLLMVIPAALVAGWFRYTVQLPETLLSMMCEHEMEDKVTGAETLRTVLADPPFNPAVITAVRPWVTAPALAVNDPVDPPDPMDTVEGTVTFELLLDNVTVAPVADTGLDRVTVQFAEPEAAMVDGEQVTEAGCEVTVTVRAIGDCWINPL